MNVAFRVDASSRMGTGHVMRCLALAQALADRGAQSLFVCRNHPGHLIDLVRERGWDVQVLDGPATDSGLDAAQTLLAVRDHTPDWLVVDHYGLDAAWEALVRPRVGRLLSIDDLERAHHSDVVLDQNYAPSRPHRYRDLVPAGCRVLLGPRYALLDANYEVHRRTQSTRPEVAGRVLVYFGGVDAGNMTGVALAALCAPEFLPLHVDVVIGRNHAQGDVVRAQADARPRTRVFGARHHLADLMAEADVAIGAGGVTTWERMCLGLPTLVISHADNQTSACEALAADGLIEYLGDHKGVGHAEIARGLASLLGHSARRQQLSSRGRALVDGRGASRVADVMLGRDPHAVALRKHVLHAANTCPSGFGRFVFAWIDRCDSGRVLALRNQPHVRGQMRTQTAISADAHALFFAHYRELDRYDFVLVDTENDRYVGVFYVTGLATSPELGKYIGDVSYLGQGIARAATASLLEFCRSSAGLDHLRAVTRVDNAGNIALNTSLGFTPAGPPLDDYLVMERDI
jgi:UDP-2,4-diacetamido-2,4,6-trideoxy-beta-L-altropyranose hydrolase